ncbi:hypothetical protein EA462_09935 [Natrarchaeobius halalkaliphilus]|uniref:Uncharacterized protein n=1 Tax=Natrarchaeobius halalkaliphilus TaxID=1679091 RepID=A0A3N6LML6_9EURY|nr:hypothetical protein [Natrarchaeobius halalkaliphilus]RQG90288.1 hypothetical protein EA462_09935 [Natrarchaeobius halalkaliphilus]
MRDTLTRDERGLSTAVTHVLTMGITTVLVAGLLVSSGTLIDHQTDRSAEQSLETIGERLAGEITHVDRLASDGDSVTVIATHPRTIAGSTYRVGIEDSRTCAGEPLLDGSTVCLRLSSTDADAEVFVPISNESELNSESLVTGGTIEIEHNGTTNEIELQ